MTEPLPPPPTPSGRDKLVEVAVSAAGEVPVLGTVAEVLRQIFGTPYENRQRAAQVMIFDAVCELQERSIDLDELGDRPAFVSAVHEASRIALGEHLDAKLDMLKAVLVAHGTTPASRTADIAVLRFLRLVDELEPEHIVALRATSSDALVERNDAEAVQSARDMLAEFDTLDLSDTHAVLLLQELVDRLLIEPRSTSAAARLRSNPIAERASGVVNHPEGFRVTTHGSEFLDWLDII